MDETSATCLVHLVRRKNGLQPFSAFLDSYRRHDAGIDHVLVVIFKGFEDESELADYYNLLSGLPFRSLRVPDIGFDIGPYFSAARAFEYQYFCFLNSFSLILDHGWLGKMHKHIERKGVGIVGATGSHESMLTNLIRSLKPQKPSWLFWKKHLGNLMDNSAPRMSPRINFPRFPNYHVRTNCFLVSRELLLKIKVNKLLSKMDVYHFEAGKKSLTRQILAMDLGVLVVGRDGEAYEKDHWRESRTYRSGEQENLLVSDNLTRVYEAADPQMKTTLTENTWGQVSGEQVKQ